MLDCKILTSDAEIEALARPWRELHVRAGSSIFTDYDWYDIWRRTLGQANGRTMHVITGNKDGRLVALLPLAVIRRKGFRVLQAIGAESFYYCATLCEEDEYADELWRVALQSPHYDFAHIRDVAPDSVCERTLAGFARLHDRVTTLSLKLDWPSGETWKAALSKNLRKNLDKATRHLAEKGVVRYQIYRNEPIPDGVIDAMVQYKTAWCEEQGLEGMFDQPGILEYYRQMAHMAAKNGSLVLTSLTCGEEILAAHIMFIFHKTLHSYVLGTNAAWNKYSPGNLAHMHAIMWAIDNGFDLFDHMQGGFAYKYQFSNQERENREYSFHSTLKGALGETLFFGCRRLKRLFSN